MLNSMPNVDHVFAACRSPSKCSELIDLKQEFANKITLVKLDSTDEESIKEAQKQVAQQTDRLDVLLNVSGILKPDTSIRTVTRQDLMDSFQTNTIGPLLVAKHFQAMLHKKSTSNDPELTFEQGAPLSILANVSAKVGSIQDNRIGGWTAYRASKAALNMITKNCAIELNRKNVVCVSLHPGTVDTDLSKPFQKNIKKEKLFTVELAIQQLCTIMKNIRLSDNGKFYAWDGSELPW
ncbi:hypothetical protein AKO1_007928 [Acrasis kona]|uniref:C-factor n=1 Tax=Acrasis kona TaxID=1008807 RepID=A0AAW2YPB5_9EUKA